MTWQILNVEPPYAVCDSCKSHECGIVDGKHMWIQTGIEDKYGDRQVIGYGCIHAWAENLGISKEIVTKEVLRPPAEQELRSWIVNHVMNGQAIPTVEDVKTDDSVHDNGNRAPDSPPSDVGQQAHQGTPKPKGNRSRAHNTNRATVRQS